MSRTNSPTLENRVEIVEVNEESLPVDNLPVSSIFNPELDLETETIMPGNDAPTTEALITAARNYGEIIPKFDGKANALESFIIKVNGYYEKYGNTNDVTLSNYVYCMICNRLTNEANDFVICRPDLQDWPALRQALRNKFGDLTDRKILAYQFKMLKLKSGESLSDFIERIKTMQTQVNVKVTMDDSLTAGQKIVHKEINEQTAIEVLYNNVPPMLQTILDVKMHTTMAEAANTVLIYLAKHPPEKLQKPVQKNNEQISRPMFSQRTPSQTFSSNNSPLRSPRPNFSTNRPFGQQPYMSQRPVNISTPITRGNQNSSDPPNTSIQRNQSSQPQPFTSTNNSRANVSGNRPMPRTNMSPRSNQYQTSAFRNWRQPNPQINYSEVNPFESEYNLYETNNYADMSENNPNTLTDANFSENAWCMNSMNEAECSENLYIEEDQQTYAENFRLTASDNES